MWSPKSDLCGVNELLDNVGSLDNGELSQDVTDHPKSKPVE